MPNNKNFKSRTYLPIIYSLKVAVIQTIMKMASVMITTIMKPVFLMEETAVDLMSIHSIAANVYALKEEGEEVVELQHHQVLLQLLFIVEAALKIWFMIRFVMISTIL